MSAEEQKNYIRVIDAELKKRGAYNPLFLKDACHWLVSAQENLLGIDFIRAEVIELLIDLGYSTKDIIIPLLEKLDPSKLNGNAIEVIKVLQKHCALTQEEQQKEFSILKVKEEIHCTPPVHFVVKMNKKAKKEGDYLFINNNLISGSDLQECITIKALKKLFKEQQQDDNQ